MHAEEKTSHARYWVVVFVSLLAGILYVDRVCISQAGPTIQEEFHLTKEQMGTVYSAFTLAYALFEIPGGWLGDRFGVRKVLTRIVVWWSIFTAATGFAWNYASLLVTRFLFGAGEAGCFPNTAKAYSIWLPSSERNRAQSVLWISARWAGAFTPLLVLYILRIPGVTWRRAFMMFGSVGTVWAVIYYLWFRDNPKDHRGVNSAERELLSENVRMTAGHGDVPWRRFFSSSTTWLIWLQYFCFSYVWYFYITWLPTFLKEKFPDVSPEMRALLAGFPLFMGGLGSFCTAFFSSAITRWTGSVARTRRIIACSGFAAAALALLVPTLRSDPLFVMGALGLASFLCDFVIPVSWSTCIDVGGRFSGTYSGSMNMMGNLGGAVGPYMIGFILTRMHNNWNVTYYISSAVFLIGAICWLFIDPVTPMDEPEAAPRIA